MKLRDELITGSFMIGEDGQKEPINWKDYALRLEEKVESHPSTPRQLEDAAKEIEKLKAFKEYVHQRLDDAGIEKNPEGEHSKHGCRIGDRLDIALAQHEDWISVEKELKRLIELKPYHIMPYNLGDMGEMGQIIDRLQKLLPQPPSTK